MSIGKLYLVATPIGNLGDLSVRAAAVLGQADFIAAEDTRVSQKLLSHLDLHKPMVSYYEHNRRQRGEEILQRIISGETCALVTDAGTPAISDPGEDLVALCASHGVACIPIPGACAAVCALAASGLPSGRWCFEGFLSVNKKARRAHLDAIKDETRTMIFYEAPHKLRATLQALCETFGQDRRISLSRELTKLHEDTKRCTLGEAAAFYEQTAPRGEYVLVLEGKAESADEADADARMQAALSAVLQKTADGATLKDAVKEISAAHGVKKNALYRMVLETEEKPNEN